MSTPVSTPVSTSRSGAEKRKLPLSAIPQPRPRRLSPLAQEEASQQQEQRKPRTLSTCAIDGDVSSAGATSTTTGVVVPQAFARNHAVRAMGKQGALPRTGRHTANLPAGLASPTDKLMSPATRGVNKLRHKKNEHLPKPRVLSAIFESMKDKK